MLTPQFKLTVGILSVAILIALLTSLTLSQSNLEKRVSGLEMRGPVVEVAEPTASPSATPKTEITPTKTIKTPTPTESSSEVQ